MCFFLCVCAIPFVDRCGLVAGRGGVLDGVHGKDGVGLAVPQLLHQRLGRVAADLAQPHAGLPFDGAMYVFFLMLCSFRRAIYSWSPFQRCGVFLMLFLPSYSFLLVGLQDITCFVLQARIRACVRIVDCLFVFFICRRADLMRNI